METVPDGINLNAYMQPTAEADNVRPASTWVEKVVERIRSGGVTGKVGSRMGWPKTHEQFRFVPSGTTLWVGINGHGKSLFTGQVQLDLMMAGEPNGLASMEMLPDQSMERMCFQAFGGAGLTEDFTRMFHTWTDGRFWIYDVQGSVKWERVIACGRYMASQGVKHFWVDSLMKCVADDDDYNSQKNFVSALCGLAQETGMHCHLVHHSKKLADESQKPGKFDARGSGSITDQIENVLTVWRNKAKEHARSNGKQFDYEAPDALVICDKQRHNGGWEGTWGFWYHPGSKQYLAHGVDEPRQYFDGWFADETL